MKIGLTFAGFTACLLTPAHPGGPGPAPHLPPEALAATDGGSVAATPDQERRLGSAVPCAVPLRWRLGSVDPRFGLDPDEAVVAIEEAAAIWERAMGRRLVVRDPSGGFPVDFEFDDRQALLQLRNRSVADLDATDRGLDSRRAALGAMTERFEAAQAEYQSRAGELQRRTATYNDEVRRWNERGGAPEAVLEQLQGIADRLRADRESLESAEAELRDVHAWINDETDRLNRGVEDRNRQAGTLEESFAHSVTESGRYDERVEVRGREVLSVERNIRVFRFSDRVELVLVIAHEFGHALGLGHAAVRGALMSDVLSGDGPGLSGAQASDVAMLRARCPTL